MLAFIIALGLRLIKLGTLPLTDGEADAALQALQIAQGLKPTLSPHPLYILATSILFFIFGASNFMARLIPALAGSALVLAPCLFREQLKPRPALILAFFLAIEPGLIAISRQSASSMLAITCLLLAWGFWNQKKIELSGACAALALLSGPALWTGLLGLGITWAIRQAMESRTKNDNLKEKVEAGLIAETNQPSAASSVLLDHGTRKSLVLSFVLTLIIAGTLFFLAPNGLSAAFASVPEYVLSWTQPSGIPTGRLFVSLLVYQPLAILMAVLALIRGWRNGSRRIILLSLWLLIALLLVVFYPARQVSELVWVLLPFWALAALELARHLQIPPLDRREIVGMVLLIFLILVFAWFDLAGILWTPFPSPQASARIWLLFGSMFLLVLSSLLVAVGWSIRIAKSGTLWGFTLSLGIYTLAVTLGTAGLRGGSNPELWWLDERPAQAELLQATADDLSDWSMGQANAQPIVISGLESPALAWILRTHQVTVMDTLDVSSTPPIVITPAQADPALAAAYRGQDFTWRQRAAWDSAQAMDWLRWFILRQMPQTGETIILWARNDLFLDARSLP